MGHRVEIIPQHTSQWLAGDRYGQVVEIVARIQFIKGRVDDATGRREDDEIVDYTEFLRVKLEGSGELVEVLRADCNEFDDMGNKLPPAKGFHPFNPRPRSGDWVREQYEEEITDLMHFCGDEFLEEAGRKPGGDGRWSEEDIALMEQICRERHPFEQSRRQPCPS